MMKKLVLYIAFIVFVLTACDSSVVYDKSQSVKEKGWNMNDKLYFEVDIKDTLRLYNFAINVRNTTDYPYSNLFFFIKTVYPDGSITKCDTVECRLALNDGTWTGKGSGKIKDSRFWFTKNVVFPMKGKYRFEIQQATRDSNIVGSKNIGLHIEYRK